ncbi:unnamed protein product, partial [Didymodactylos carnosus]
VATPYSSTVSSEEEKQNIQDVNKGRSKREKFRNFLLIFKIFQLNQPEWPYVLIGLVSACISGLELPATAYIMVQLYSILISPHAQYYLNFMTIMLLIVGIGGSLFQLFVSLSFTKSGSELTLRIRSMSFKAILRQEIAWHDEDINSVGALMTRLSSDASALESFTGARIGIMTKAITSLAASLLVSFVVSWRLSLIGLLFIPWMLFCGMLLDERTSENASTTGGEEGGQ